MDRSGTSVQIERPGISEQDTNLTGLTSVSNAVCKLRIDAKLTMHTTTRGNNISHLMKREHDRVERYYASSAVSPVVFLAYTWNSSSGTTNRSKEGLRSLRKHCITLLQPVIECFR